MNLKLRRVLPLGLAASSLLGVGIFTAGPAAAEDFSVHTLRLEGTMDIRDDEPWPVNQRWCRNLQFSAAQEAQYPTRTSAVAAANRKCDGEIRVDVQMTGSLHSDGSFCVKGTVRLYEGVTENPADRKLRATSNLNNGSGGCYNIGGRGGWATWTGTAQANAGDRVNFTVTARNT